MQSDGDFGRHFLRVALLLVPVAYVAQVSATGCHELLGHGLTAVLVGGQFTGFSLAWDGMGWASVDAPGSNSTGPRIAVLAGGVASTCAAGLVLLVTAARIRNGPARWVLLVFAACTLLEGASYSFWSAWQFGDRGDIALVLHILEATPGGGADAWRAAILAVGGSLTVVGNIVPLARLLSDLEESCPPEIQLTPRRRALIAAGLGAVGVASWWLFDWEQLLPGVGALPSLTGSALVAGTAAWWAIRPASLGRPSDAVRVGAASIAWWWAVAAALAASTLLWLGPGVRWG